MNSEIEVNENKFELSVLGAFGMVALYYVIIDGIIATPFCILSEIEYVSSHKILKLFLQIITYLIPKVTIVILLLRKVRGEYKQDFKISYIKKFNFKLLLCTVFSMVGLYLCLQSSIGLVLAKLPVSKFVEEALKELTEDPYLTIIIAIIVGPIIEEIVMRGIILEGLLNKNKPIISIIVSAIIFGAVHMNLPQSINAAILGILFGYIYYKTRSLALCIACHMVNNTIAILNVNYSIITFLIGTAIFITAIVFFERFLKRLDSDDINLKKNIG